MGLPYERDLKVLARSLRNSMTDAERKLWAAIRRKQVRGMLFTRQRPVGEYIVDFLCSSASLVVEVDGGQHFTAEGRGNDRRRDSALEEMGLRVLRFSDRDVLTNLEGVLQVIWEVCGEAQNPLAPPLPKGEEVPEASGSSNGEEVPVACRSSRGKGIPVASGSTQGEEVPEASGSSNGEEVPVACRSSRGKGIPVASGSPKGAASLVPPFAKGGQGGLT